MLSDIDLCNQALLKIGELPITSFTGTNVASQIASGLYSLTIDALLCRHNWNFAIKEYSLTPALDGSFTIPIDVLRVIDCGGLNYKIIDWKIKTDASEIVITAIARIVAEQFPAYFIPLVITKLAMEFCIPLTGNQNTFALLNALFENEMNVAKFIDSSSATSQTIKNFSLLETRF